MKFHEYGKEKKDTVILLHGGGLSWWNYREAAENLQDEYHVILPVLDGHAESGRPFTSIEDNAKEIIAFIDEACGGSVTLAGGLSLGGQVLLEMLARRPDLCRYAVTESAAVIPAKLTNMMIAPAFGSSFGLIQNRSFAKLQFHSLRLKDDLFEDYYRDTCRITKSDMIAFMKASTSYALKDAVRNTSAQVHVFCGEKETGEIRKSAEMIRETIPGSQLHVLPGLYHGEFSICHAGLFAEALRNIMHERNPVLP